MSAREHEEAENDWLYDGMTVDKCMAELTALRARLAQAEAAQGARRYIEIEAAAQTMLDAFVNEGQVTTAAERLADALSRNGKLEDPNAR